MKKFLKRRSQSLKGLESVFTYEAKSAVLVLARRKAVRGRVYRDIFDFLGVKSYRLVKERNHHYQASAYAFGGWYHAYGSTAPSALKFLTIQLIKLYEPEKKSTRRITVRFRT